MAKKYLLYIHDDRFNNEEKKSGLVNRLLAEHYANDYRRVEDGTPKAVRIAKNPKTVNEVEAWAGPIPRNKKKL